jgi:hypothetical protein
MGLWLDPTVGESMKLNWSMWRPILEIIGDARIVDDATLDVMGSNNGCAVTAAESVAIADAVDAVVAAMPEDARLILGGEVTTEPDDFRLHRDHRERNYTIPRDLLRKFAAFSRASQGFNVG